jgi:phosphomannomutase / phosphoglucomutase
VDKSNRLFGTNGIRGVYKSDLTQERICDLVLSTAKYFKNGTILIGFDGRHNNKEILDLVSSSLNNAGLDAVIGGLIPTPCLQYATKKLGYQGGIMITASHNPPQYNGLKITAKDGVEIPREDELIIEKTYYEKTWNRDLKKHGETKTANNIIRTYIDGIKSLVDVKKIKSKKIKIVLDLGNGAQSVTAPLLCDELGCDTILINDKVDGSFPGRGPEPMPENLQDLSKKVVEHNADFGVAFDGDGDRSIFCDNKGEILGGDKSALVLARYLLNKHPKSTIVTTVNSTSVIEQIARETNSKVIRTKVGSVDVSREMVLKNALIGFEENGGFMYSKHNAVRDGAMTMAIVIDMLSASVTSFREEIESIPSSYTKKHKYTCSKENAEQLINYLEKNSNASSSKIDGIKINFADNRWIMVRSSGTEPIIRIYVEGNTQKDLDELFLKYCKTIEEFLKAHS